MLTPRTIQAHCTYLSPEELSFLAQRGTAIAHCPLSNAYFSARQFVLREALDRGVCVGLGTDVAGGYSIDIMGAMRWAVGVSRLLEGARLESSEWQASATDREIDPAVYTRSVQVDWKETLYLGTRGGALALGLGGGVFKIGAPFDAQQSWHPTPLVHSVDHMLTLPLLLVSLSNPTMATNGGTGTGPLDLFDPGSFQLSPEVIEKWWCLGDARNRTGLWIQGQRIDILLG